MESKRRTTFVLIGLVAIAAIAWLAVSASILLDAADRAQSGVDILEDVDALSESDPAELLSASAKNATDDGPTGEDVSAELRAAAVKFDDANKSVTSPVLAPLRYVPIIGTQIKSVDSLSSAASEVSISAASAFDDLQVVLDDPAPGPSARAQTVGDIGVILAEFNQTVSEVDLGPLEGLIPPLARARDDVSARVFDLETNLNDATAAAIGTAEFLKGPSNYLLFAANNAEMRAGSGMFLQAAPLEVVDGSFSFGDFEPTDSMILAHPGAVLDPDVEHLWGGFSPDQDFRNVNLTPRFNESARTAAEMWESSGRGVVEGVMAVDVVALRLLLELVGPVEAPGANGRPPILVDADTVIDEILVQQYRDFEGDQSDRRDQLGRVAAAVLEALNTRDVSASDLLEVLAEAARGRHLLAWSDSGAENAAWSAIGADGAVSETQVGTLLMNRGGDKLDAFMQMSVQMSEADTPTAGNRRIRLEVDLANNAPEGLPQYVSGPAEGSTYPEGTYQGILQFVLPGTAVAVDAWGVSLEEDRVDLPLIAAGPDGMAYVYAPWVDLARGESETIVAEFSIPESVETIEILPSARAVPVDWSIGGEEPRTVSDRRPRLIETNEL